MNGYPLPAERSPHLAAGVGTDLLAAVDYTTFSHAM
jgi:hypothetical protein